jgi:hypothetical protein
MLAKPKTAPQLLTEFIDGLNSMISSAGVMIHHHQDLRWEFIRKILEETKDATVKTIVNPMTAPKRERFVPKTQILLP